MAPTGSAETLLAIRDLAVQYPADHGAVRAVAGVTLTVGAGECVGIVGESGSGKTQLLLSILGLSAPHARLRGSIRYRAQELIGMRAASLNAIRGRRIGVIFQDPMTALNPYMRIGRQITEVARTHLGLGRRAADRRAIEMLVAVHISEPERRLRQYPHELSGGMRQRVMIAMALSCEPELLLADEPTTALDVTVQAQILSVLRELRARTGTAVVLVTHDLGVIAEMADRVAVMYAGRIVEQAPVDELFARPRHPYTEALLRSIPRLDVPLPTRLASIGGTPPNPSSLPPGCPFAPRCIYRMDICEQATPPLTAVAPMHDKACYHEGALGRLQAEVA
ncbi:MAG: ABC transporter ATP-binding protein [Steroidobacterales bacterium]